MPIPILATKLYRPLPRASLIRRERLYARLDGVLERKLALVSAPAGYGKSTLVSDWIDHLTAGLGAASPQVAWVSLDAGDDDPARFLGYLAAALRPICLSAAELVLSALDDEPLPPLENLLTALINKLVACAEPALLVLDDYYHVGEERIHRALDFLLAHLPRSLHLAILTRVNPPLDLASLRLHGDLVELGQAELAFTAKETARYLGQALAQPVDEAEAQMLTTRTEGWAAGIQSAALAMVGQDAPARAAYLATLAGADRRVADLLTDQVYLQQSQPMRRFLLTTAALERMCGPLCDAATGMEGGQERLKALERANLFLAPLDNERRWYRYHRLFRDLLRARLEREHPGMAARVCQAASQWFASQGLMDEALEHALAAGDGEGAARLLGAMAEGLLSRGEHGRLARLARRLPPAALLGDTRLAADCLYALIETGQHDASSRLLRQIRSQAAPKAQVAARLLALEAYLVREQRDHQRPLDLVERVLARIDTDGSTPYALNTRGLALTVAESLRRSWRQYDAATTAAREALACFRAAGNRAMQINALCMLAQNELYGGRAGRSEAHLSEAEWALARWRQESALDVMPLAASTRVHLAWAHVHEWRGRWQEGVHHRERAVLGAEITEAGVHWVLVGAAQLGRLQGDRRTAQDYLDRLDARGYPTPALREHVEAMALPVWLWLAGGDPERGMIRALTPRASAWQARNLLDEEQIGDPASFWSVRTHAWAQVWAGQAQEALRLLDVALAASLAPAQRMLLRSIQATGLGLLGREREALAALRAYLDLAAPGELVLPLAMCGAPMAGLLRVALQEGLHTSFVRRALELIDAATGGSPAAPPVNATLPEPLTERELQVLRLMAARLNSTEIAEQLIIGISTSRSHIRSIHRKLGAHSRDEAVGKAEDLGLI